MSKYIISTDNTTDLPEDYISQHELGMMSLAYLIDGKTYTRGNELPYKEFYARMRNGSMPTTSQVNPEEAKREFQKYLDQGKDIIHIAFSSALSGSYNSARVAAEELKEEMPERKITVIDSLSASLGEGLLVHKALELQSQGVEYEELVKWIEEHKLHVIHNITVDDLNHLYRGGRVSKAAAVLGTIVNIKPIIKVDDDGKLLPIDKVRGRKKALTRVVDDMEKKMGSYRDQNDTVCISHGDCIEDAEYVKELVETRFGIKKFIIHPIGPVIGAHSGPGTIALCFLGDAR